MDAVYNSYGVRSTSWNCRRRQTKLLHIPWQVEFVIHYDSSLGQFDFFLHSNDLHAILF